MKQRIGFIGVGLMGHGMAKNLVEKGFPLTLLGHKKRAPVDDLKKRGAKEAKDVAGRVLEHALHRGGEVLVTGIDRLVGTARGPE